MAGLSKRQIIAKKVNDLILKDRFEFENKICILLKNEIIRTVAEYTCIEEDECVIKFATYRDGRRKIVVECIVKD